MILYLVPDPGDTSLSRVAILASILFGLLGYQPDKPAARVMRGGK